MHVVHKKIRFQFVYRHNILTPCENPSVNTFRHEMCRYPVLVVPLITAARYRRVQKTNRARGAGRKSWRWLKLHLEEGKSAVWPDGRAPRLVIKRSQHSATLSHWHAAQSLLKAWVRMCYLPSFLSSFCHLLQRCEMLKMMRLTDNPRKQKACKGADAGSRYKTRFTGRALSMAWSCSPQSFAPSTTKNDDLFDS